MDSAYVEALVYAREQLAVLSASADNDDYERGVEDSRELILEIIRDNQ